MATITVLRNPRHELYAQNRVAGLSMAEAYTKAGFTSKNPKDGAANLERNPAIQQRMDQLLRGAAARAELSRKQILDRIFEDWELARKLGQVPAALKAAELMGKEMHKMFVERKEVGGPGDFDNKTEEELRQIVEDGLKELGWGEPPSPTVN